MTVEQGWLEAGYAAFNRRDADALKTLAAEDIEIVPLLSGVASPGPWSGHDGIDRLVTAAEERWARFEAIPLAVSVDGGRVTVRARVTAMTRGESGVTVEAEVLHIFDLRDGRVARFEAQRSA